MLLRIASIAALIWVLLARVLGPSDLWDQTQPKTVSYTTDILVHGGQHWLLPIERGSLPATKPPLYNWIAAPFVKLAGFSSEIAHKFPSIIALCLCWLIIVRLGRWIDRSGDGSVGWLAGLAFVGNYTIFKLGFLARPDMLLTLWMLLAWMSATVVLIRGPLAASRGIAKRGHATPQAAMVVAFWLCIELAGLTKGPPALAVMIFAFLAARLIGGSWRAVNALQWWWGLPMALAINAAWIIAVWRINPEHVRTVLLGNEILGRVTGTGPEGNPDGVIGWFITFFNLGIYFLVRFLPWSIPAVVMMWRLRRSSFKPRMDTDGHGREAEEDSVSVHPCSSVVSLLWLRSAALFVLVIICVFTLSAGKRADYIAAAFAPGSLLAAWWLLRAPPQWSVRMTWLAPLVAGLSLAAMTWVNLIEPAAPVRGFGDSINEFISRVSTEFAADPMPVVTYRINESHVQAMLGLSQSDDLESALEQLKGRASFWLLAGPRYARPHDAGEWLEKRRPRLQAEVVVRSGELPAERGWPGQVALYRVGPRDR
jgi:4-amino-4-deoxy-L-arabinose transferase-like glycosyltransferase